ncbi:N-methylpurine DNA glycosylase [Phyllostomus discolor]|uniref:DNA-3-methyladenine glycosylase II n=1 Tax=Phyllostomus discolor TaxID=89673 RepID=A0A834EQX5_9CHIR|nr:N-methylpurine DNA glycosylase [Phyllostomus discolor]
MPVRSGTQLSRKLGQKKQRRTSEAEQHQSPPGASQTPPPKEPRLDLPMTLGPQRSIYFSNRPARLGLEFFDQPPVSLAQAFLGQVLVRQLDDGTELRGRIVETEAYLGPEDEAAHSRGGRQTPRNRSMFMKPGTLRWGMCPAASAGAPGRPRDHAAASQYLPESQHRPGPQRPRSLQRPLQALSGPGH